METRLVEAGTTANVTWVLCANREDIEAMSVPLRRCLVQERTLAPGSLQMANGTLSLAFKHLLVYEDIRSLGLSAALVLEDDAAIPPSFWAQLTHPSATVPPDADIFWLGGGHRNANLGTHRSLSGSQYCGDALALKRLAGAPYRPLRPGTPTPLYCVYQREWHKPPAFIGAHAYIMTARGAESFRGWPVRGPADLVLSKQDYLCWGGSARCHMRTQYGPARWIGMRSSHSI